MTSMLASSGVRTAGTNVETPEECIRGSFAARRRRMGANLVMICLLLYSGVKLIGGNSGRMVELRTSS